jgi:pimeloyl-ACP methyl ester carboxylesterase
MAQLTIDNANALFYKYVPAAADGFTFTFFNALTGDAGMWENTVAPALHERGHGTLIWNFRGQAHSPAAPGLELGDQLIVGDAKRLLDTLQPPQPILVGLSIGGLFAAQTWLAGAQASGLVLINTLRRPGARLDWINDSALRCAEVGGLDLVKDLFGALIFNEDWLAQNREGAFKDEPYQPLTPDAGHYRLLRDCRGTDWHLPYDKLEVPVLLITGLQDDMFLNLDDVAISAGRLPELRRRVDFPNAGHMVPVERPQAFTEALLTFAEDLAN